MTAQLRMTLDEVMDVGALVDGEEYLVFVRDDPPMWVLATWDVARHRFDTPDVADGGSCESYTFAEVVPFPLPARPA